MEKLLDAFGGLDLATAAMQEEALTSAASCAIMWPLTNGSACSPGVQCPVEQPTAGVGRPVLAPERAPVRSPGSCHDARGTPLLLAHGVHGQAPKACGFALSTRRITLPAMRRPGVWESPPPAASPHRGGENRTLSRPRPPPGTVRNRPGRLAIPRLPLRREQGAGERQSGGLSNAAAPPSVRILDKRRRSET
jgi:hypothetical protein